MMEHGWRLVASVKGMILCVSVCACVGVKVVSDREALPGCAIQCGGVNRDQVWCDWQSVVVTSSGL